MLLSMALLQAAQNADAQQAGGATWTRLGTLPAGAMALAQAGDGSALYAYGSDGISHSTDGGATWAGCNREARMMRLVTPLPGQTGNNLLYASTASGLRLSDDGCRTWKDVPTQGVLPSGAHIRWLAAYPNNPQVLYAGMDGLGGLYRSIDGGANWQPASNGLPPGAWATALTADPSAPQRVFVGVRYTQGTHPPAYVYKSEDGGLTWRSSSLGIHMLPNNGGHITGLGWSGAALFAATAYDGLYASTDSGKSWQKSNLPRKTTPEERPVLPGAPPAEPMPLKVSILAATAGGALVINTPEGAFQSLDAARTWQTLGPDGARGGNLLLAIDGNSGRVVLASLKDSGMWGYQIPPGAVQAPASTAAVASSIPPTPPPAPPPPLAPTATSLPPTSTPIPTSTPTPTPTVVLVEGPKPSDRAEPLDPAVSDYFPQTGHNIKYGFRDYWASRGGVGFFGYPLTEEFVENGVTVQYFERARLEYRDGKLSLGRLGAELTEGQFFQTVRFFPSTDTNAYFGPTQHSVSGPFLTFWQDVGGLETLGFPLSESFQADGSEYQWFERGRLEWHPFFPEGKRIILGTIGTEALRKRGWIR
jgi:photosystem II stability/assembly factor-like uncharacterized protein